MCVRAAFSLMELLVVIVIISVLSALLMPVISTVMAVAKELRCGSNMRQCSIAALAWANDHEGALPKIMEADGLTFDVHLIADYGMVHNVYWCAGNTQAQPFTRILDGVTITGRRSYAMPGTYISLPADQAIADRMVCWYNFSNGQHESSHLSRVTDSSGSILYHERWDRPNGARNKFGEGWGVTSSETWNVRDEHRGKSNFLFLDGHVERRTVDSTLNGSPRGWTGIMSLGAWTIIGGD